MSILELSIVVALTGLGVALIGRGLAGAMSVGNQVANKRDVDLELTRALSDILKVGRIAQACERIREFVPANPPATTVAAWVSWMECRVDRNAPPTLEVSDDIVYRFGIWNAQFSWLRKDGTAFVPHLQYDGISEFEICDDKSMRYGGSDPEFICALPPSILATRHLANVDAVTFPTPEDRFFRFRISSVSPEASKTVQSAFFVRHPTLSGVIYQWGQHWND